MLQAYPIARPDNRSPAGAAWVDLLDPSDGERAAFEQAFALRVPTKAELAEIEATSRLRADRDVLYLTAPLIFATDSDHWVVLPTGFVLSKNVLLTVRFAQSNDFDTVVRECTKAAKIEPTLVFVRLLEVLVDRLADLLEASGRDLDDASLVMFRVGGGKRRRLSRETAMLRQLMIRTGRTSQRMSRIQYTLVCLDRIAKFAVERCHAWIAPDMAKGLQAVSSDIASLELFADGLINRIQFLQDAASGIINIDQNDVMKILTVASVAGIPPVLVVGVYGMNFKHMPELDWSWGYPYALALVVITAMVPLIWFKLKDWI
jgi:magnesium transporter